MEGPVEIIVGLGRGCGYSWGSERYSMSVSPARAWDLKVHDSGSGRLLEAGRDEQKQSRVLHPPTRPPTRQHRI